MLTKFETKSNRVKGLSFHPKRPWILASLHSGVIQKSLKGNGLQLWDYRMGTLIDRFDEHDGPVRGVSFHKSQPLFVSGGDDYKIKVWNYKLQRCLFTLLGHLDYIRTVQFHHEYPWIVSASDDQTIRIWNWQSRTCISVLTGHNHYVMCANFHLKEDLVVSASLDQTVRVWDISGLRKKTVAPSGEDSLRLPHQMNTDLFGGGDAIVKYVLEGHDRGVNWASFHPTLPLIVSGADDRQVKMWRMNDTKAWEVDTLRGHVNNVSSVMFHARQDIIVSNSEDKSIRVWDMSKRTGVQTFRREHDRFWILAAHPEINLLAAGHDSGMIVFKLERERPAFSTSGGLLYYIKDRYLRTYDFSTQRDNPLVVIKRAGVTGPSTSPRSLSYNPQEHAVLLNYDADGGFYELHNLPKDAGRGETISEAKRGNGYSACFLARNRFAVLDKSANEIVIKNLRNEITKRSAAPVQGAESIFYASTGTLLVRAEDKVVLFDVQQRQTLGELNMPFLKYAVWNADASQVALLSKHAIIIADKKLQNSTTVHETIRVKSAAWDDNGVLIYTTLNHIKFCLPNGDSGIIQTLDNPVYITKVFGNVVYCLDRDGKNKQITIDTTECVFKLALQQRKFDQVLQMVRSGALCGQAIIAYLQQKGYPEVALHFVKDEATRFNLAIECGNIEVALQSAQELDNKETWHRLGVEALRQGNHQIVEFSYQKTKNFERLSFLYLITGNLEKLAKMLKIAEMRGDSMGAFHNALYLGDVQERVKLLAEAGQGALAYATAKTHGLDEKAEEIGEGLEELPPVNQDARLLQPPTPILRLDNWALLQVSKGFFENLAAKTARGDADDQAAAFDGLDEEELDDGAWGGEPDIDIGDEEEEIAEAGNEYDLGEGGEDDEDGGWEMEDLDLPPETPTTRLAEQSAQFVAPTSGNPPSFTWLNNCKLAVDFVAAGNADTAMRMLNRQLGITNFEPLKPYFLDIVNGTQAYLPTLPGISSVPVFLDRDWSEDSEKSPPKLPVLTYDLSNLEDRLKIIYKSVTDGKFSEALRLVHAILHIIPLTTVETRKEVDELKELIEIAREYSTALRCELTRKDVRDDNVRMAELAAYFTHFKLQPAHKVLGLRSALTIFYKLKNFNTAAEFCRRLLELNPPVKFGQQARSVLAACEKNPTDAVRLNYDPRNPFDTCPLTFTPIYRGNKFETCPYTGARFQPDCKGKLSPVGELATIGQDASGLICSRTQLR